MIEHLHNTSRFWSILFRFIPVIIITTLVYNQNVDGFSLSPTSVALPVPSSTGARLPIIHRHHDHDHHHHHYYTVHTHHGNCNVNHGSFDIIYRIGKSSSTTTTTSLPLYIDPFQSMSPSTPKNSNHPMTTTSSSSSSSLSYRNDPNIDENIINLVESVYNTTSTSTTITTTTNGTNDQNKMSTDNGTNEQQQLSTENENDSSKRKVRTTKSYILLHGVEEVKSLSATFDNDKVPKVTPQYCPPMTLLSRDGMMERHMNPNYVTPPICTMNKSELPLEKQLIRTTKKYSNQQQRISFFHGGEPFISLSNLEYNVTDYDIFDSTCTGFFLSLLMIVSMIYQNSNFNNEYYYYSYYNDYNTLNINVLSCILVTIPTITTYMSVTRSTIGELTRLGSHTIMNVLRLFIVLYTEIKQNITTSTTITATTTKKQDSNNQNVSNIKPLPSIPILLGELVWYNTINVIQRTKHIIQQTSNTINNYQVNLIRIERIKNQELKQRKLLQTQLYYNNKMKKMKMNQSKTINDINTTSNSNKNNNNTPSQENSESDLVLSTEITTVRNNNDVHYEITTFPEYAPLLLTNNQVNIDNVDHETIINDEHITIPSEEALANHEMILSQQQPQQQYQYEPMFLLGTEDEQNGRLTLERSEEETTTRTEYEPMFVLGNNERIDDDKISSTETHILLSNIENMNPMEQPQQKQYDPMFLLGQEQRVDVDILPSSETHVLFGTINYNQSLHNEEAHTAEHEQKINETIIPQSEPMFALGNLEREVDNDILASTETHVLYGNIENSNLIAKQQQQYEPMFLLGQEQRVEVDILPSTETHVLYGNINNNFDLEKEDETIIPSVSLEFVNVTNHTNVFQMEDEAYDTTMINNDTFPFVENDIDDVDYQIMSTNHHKNEAVLPMEEENDMEEQISKIHLLLQERARMESLKRLQRIMSHTETIHSIGNHDELMLNKIETHVATVQYPAKINNPSTNVIKVKRTWKNLSYQVGKVKQYILRASTSSNNIVHYSIKNRYTFVQRGAMYLIASTSSLFMKKFRMKSNVDDVS